MQISANPSAAYFCQSKSPSRPTVQPVARVSVNSHDGHFPTANVRFAAHSKTQELESAFYKERYQTPQQIAELKSLIQAGADVNAIITGSQETLLTRAIRKRDIPQIKLLCQDLGADPNQADDNGTDRAGYTPLMAAVMDGQPDLIALLKSLGAKPEANNHRGQNAVTTAAGFGKVPELIQLHDLGADLDARDGKGFTPLTMAVKKNQTNVIQRLHTFGVDLKKTARDERTQREKSPLEMAKGETKALLDNLIRLDEMDESPANSRITERPSRQRRTPSILSGSTRNSEQSFVSEAHITNPFNRPGSDPASDAASLCSYQSETHIANPFHRPGSDVASIGSRNSFNSAMLPSLDGLLSPTPGSKSTSATALEVMDKFMNNTHLTEAENASLIEQLSSEVAQSMGRLLRAQVNAQAIPEEDVALQILQNRLQAVGSDSDPQGRISQFWQQVDMAFR